MLYKHVNNIAQSYGTEPVERRDAYIKAAKDFRMPYWDWALQTNEDVTLFPWEVWSSTIPSVIRPGSQGKSTPMSCNPLASYQFGSEGQRDQGGAINKVWSLFTFDFYLPKDLAVHKPGQVVWDKISCIKPRYVSYSSSLWGNSCSCKSTFWNTMGNKILISMQFPKVCLTLCWPNDAGNASDKSTLQTWLNAWKPGNDRDKFNMSRVKNLFERVFWILTAHTNFVAMCCNLFPGSEPKWNNWGSLEDVHGDVHNYVGNRGRSHEWSLNFFFRSSVLVTSHVSVCWLLFTLFFIALTNQRYQQRSSLRHLAGVAQWHHLKPDFRGAKWQISWHTSSRQRSETECRHAFGPVQCLRKDWRFLDVSCSKDTKTFGHVYSETKDWVYKNPADIKSQLTSLYSYGSLSTMFNKPSIRSNHVSRTRLHSLVAQIHCRHQRWSRYRQTVTRSRKKSKRKLLVSRFPQIVISKNLVIDNKYLE